jgi:hypothetical protein
MSSIAEAIQQMVCEFPENGIAIHIHSRDEFTTLLDAVCELKPSFSRGSWADKYDYFVDNCPDGLCINIEHCDDAVFGLGWCDLEYYEAEGYIVLEFEELLCRDHGAEIFASDMDLSELFS